MQATSGSSSRASAPNSIEPVGALTLGRLAFLLALGGLTVLLHETFRYPLDMPGRHGLEAMALLVLGRLACTHRWSASIVCLSAVAMASATGMDIGPAKALLNIVPGLVLDLAVMVLPSWRVRLYALPLIAALAHATKPLVRFGMSEIAGVQFDSLRHGVLYPVSSHFLYGLAGSTIAVVLWSVTVKRWRQH